MRNLAIKYLAVLCFTLLLTSCYKEERNLNKFAGGWTISEYQVQEVYKGQIQFDSTYKNVGYITLYNNIYANDLMNRVEMQVIPSYSGYFRHVMALNSQGTYASNRGLWTSDSPDNYRIAFEFYKLDLPYNFRATVDRLKKNSFEFSFQGNKVYGNEVHHRVETYKLERSSF
ncbi:MAG: hypothetical protein EP332_11105 [Bacteroidetes bacterium]|nr:MAG: hypothetical protein EP332_11105 [Bacteroidota bacterium]